MSHHGGLGAAFFGPALFAVVLAIAGLLVVTTMIAYYWRHRQVPALIQYIAVGLVGVVGVVAGFGIVVLVDEAILLAVLFGVIVILPLVLVAGRARWAGASWVTVGAIAGMAWSLPFLAGVGLVFVLQTNPDLSTPVITGLAGIVTTGGALLAGEYIGSILAVEYSSSLRA